MKIETVRDEAIEWWNNLQIIEKSLLAQKYSDYLLGRGYTSLTGREIESIWINEIKTN